MERFALVFIFLISLNSLFSIETIAQADIFSHIEFGVSRRHFKCYGDDLRKCKRLCDKYNREFCWCIPNSQDRSYDCKCKKGMKCPPFPKIK